MSKEKIIERAIALNFWGKKLESTRLDCARQVKEQAGSHLTGEEIMVYLLASKPSKKPEKTQDQVALDPVFSGQLEAKERNRPVIESLEGEKQHSFLITAAQNNTKVNAPFFNNLKAYADHIGAQLIVLPVFYNTEAFSGVKGSDEKRSPKIYDPLVVHYMVWGDSWLGYSFGTYLASEVNVLPTAKLPINAVLKIMGNAQHAILGHTKQQAKTLPRMKGEAVRYGWTTGTTTIRHYVEGRAGAESEADHCFGALLVEACAESNETLIRNIQSRTESGSFFDLGLFVDGGVVSEDYETERGFIAGDIHSEKCSNESRQRLIQAVAATGLDNLTFVAHDLHDFMSRNHHNRQSGAFLASMMGETVRGDLENVVAFLTEIWDSLPLTRIVVVESNHDQALDRWLDDPRYDPRTDPVNAEFYYSLNAAKYGLIREGKDTNPILPIALEVAGLSPDDIPIEWLQVDQSFKMYGAELGCHGHIGSNGARGNPVGFAGMGIDMVTGHTHSPTLIGKCLTVGVTGDLDMGYNKGASSWDHAGGLLHPDGAKQLIRYL